MQSKFLKNVDFKSAVWISIILILVGVLLWAYSDYEIYNSLPGIYNCGTLSPRTTTVYATAAVSNNSGSPTSPCIGAPSSWYPLIYMGIALIIVGALLWSYKEHKGGLILLRIALLSLGVIVWAYGDYTWLVGSLSSALWLYMVGSGIGLIVAGTVLWAYLDRKMLL